MNAEHRSCAAAAAHTRIATSARLFSVDPLMHAAWRVATLVIVLGCLLFVHAGARLAVSARTGNELWTGLLAVAFFGGSIIAMMLEMRRRH